VDVGTGVRVGPGGRLAVDGAAIGVALSTDAMSDVLMGAAVPLPGEVVGSVRPIIDAKIR
jgi:hypothetical protein